MALKIKILLFLTCLSFSTAAQDIKINLNLIVENSEKISVNWDHQIVIHWDNSGSEKHPFLLSIKTPDNYLIEGQKPISGAQFNYKLKINSLLENFNVSIIAEDGTQMSKANLVVEMEVLKGGYHLDTSCAKGTLRHLPHPDDEVKLISVFCKELAQSRMQISARDILIPGNKNVLFIPYETEEDTAQKLAFEKVRQDSLSTAPAHVANSSLALGFHILKANSPYHDFSALGINYTNQFKISAYQLQSSVKADLLAFTGNSLSPKENKVYAIESLLSHQSFQWHLWKTIITPSAGLNMTHLSFENDRRDIFIALPIALNFSITNNFTTAFTVFPIATKNNFFAFNIIAKYNWGNLFSEAKFNRTSFNKKNGDLIYDSWEMSFGRNF